MSHYGDEIAAKRRVVKGSLTSLGVFRQVIGVNSQLKPVGTHGITQAPNIHWRAKSRARPGGDSRRAFRSAQRELGQMRRCGTRTLSAGRHPIT